MERPNTARASNQSSSSSLGTRLFSSFVRGANGFLDHHQAQKKEGTTIQLDKYSKEANSLITEAQSLADENQHAKVDTIHLLAKFLEADEDVLAIFKHAGISVENMATKVSQFIDSYPQISEGQPSLSTGMIALLSRSEKEAEEGEIVSLENVLNALTQEINGPVGKVFQEFGIKPNSLKKHMEDLKATNSTTSVFSQTAPTSTQAKTVRTSLLNNLNTHFTQNEIYPIIGRDAELRRLTQILERKQKNHPLLIGLPGVGKTTIVISLIRKMLHKEVPSKLQNAEVYELDLSALMAGAKMKGEIEDRFRQVVKTVKNHDSILLIENIDNLLSGSGSGVIDLLKPLMNKGECRILATTTPDGFKKMQDKEPIFTRNLTPLTIDPSNTEQAIEIIRGIIPRFEKFHGVMIGDPAITTAVRLAKRYIQDRQLPDNAIDLLDEASSRKQVENSSLPAEIDKSVSRLNSLKAQLSSLENDTDPMSTKTKKKLTKEISELEPVVSGITEKYRNRRKAIVEFDTLKTNLENLTKELETAKKKEDFARVGELEYSGIPQAQQKLDEASKYIAEVEAQETEGKNVILTEEDVAKVLTDWTNIPVNKMLESENAKLMNMEKEICKVIKGQDEAVQSLAKSVIRSRLGLRDPGKPIGSFLFLGSSGCGKTEVSRQLSSYLFQDAAKSFIRFDMSEYMERHHAASLVGSPPGYVDSDKGGVLTEAVKANPYCVILFDEVEKAHPDIFNLLLQILDSGKLGDSRGNIVDFSNTVIILTSNIGSKKIIATDPKTLATVEGREALTEVIKKELTEFLRPEFLNRLDSINIFNILSKENLLGIADVEIKKVEKLLVERELSLNLTEACKNHLVESSYDPLFGARPLKRAIMKNIQDPLADTLLHGGYPNGSTINVDFADGKFTFENIDAPQETV